MAKTRQAALTKKATKLTYDQKLTAAKRLAEQVRRANKAFGTSSPAKRRVQLARDVIVQMKIGRINAAHGVWVGFPKAGALEFDGSPDLRNNEDAPLVTDPNTELGTLIQQKETCNCCATGALLVCAVLKADAFPARLLGADPLHGSYRRASKGQPIPLSIDYTDVFRYLGRFFFSKKQLALIEAAFESGEGACGNNVAGSYFEGLGRNLDAAERLELIMQNIIVNDGDFGLDIKPILTIPGYVK